MTVRFAERCAWRAIYVYRGSDQIAYLGFDPKGEYGPSLFGGIARRSFRWRVPVLRWRMDRGPIGRAAYQAQEWTLHCLDGRYGGIRRTIAAYRNVRAARRGRAA